MGKGPHVLSEKGEVKNKWFHDSCAREFCGESGCVFVCTNVYNFGKLHNKLLPITTFGSGSSS